MNVGDGLCQKTYCSMKHKSKVSALSTAQHPCIFARCANEVWLCDVSQRCVVRYPELFILASVSARSVVCIGDDL